MMRVLLIEDDQALAEFIVKGLTEAGFSVEHQNNGPDGLAAALTSFFEVCIVDIMLPGLDGISLIATLRNRHLTMPILILSAKQGVDDRVRGLEKGADDYLVKPFSFTELLARVNALIRRAKGRSETTSFQVADLSLDLMSRKVIRSGQEIPLQTREFELLAYLMRNAGRVVSKTMIIENVWNYQFDPQTNIVEVRISKLREKVDRDFSPKLIHTIRGAGYVLRDED